MKLTALVSTDKSWAKGGFVHDESTNQIYLNDVDLLFLPKDEKNVGIIAWGWEGLPEGIESICGIPAFQWLKTSKVNDAAKQKNTTTSIDHVVVHTNDSAKLIEEFKSFGIDLRAERKDIYPGITQLFFRPGGGTVIEVIVNKDVENTFIWGLTLVVQDMDKAKQILGEKGASNPKQAIQKGRKIMTVRGDEVNIHTNMAMMTPHVKTPKL